MIHHSCLHPFVPSVFRALSEKKQTHLVSMPSSQPHYPGSCAWYWPIGIPGDRAEVAQCVACLEDTVLTVSSLELPQALPVSQKKECVPDGSSNCEVAISVKGCVGNWGCQNK